MRLRFILGVSLKQLWNNVKSTIVVFLSLTVCVTSVFLMAEALLYSNNFIQNIEVNRRTYMEKMCVDTGHRRFVYGAVVDCICHSSTVYFGKNFGGVYSIREVAVHSEYGHHRSYICCYRGARNTANEKE